MWVGLTQSVEDVNRTKRQKKKEFALSVLLPELRYHSSPALRLDLTPSTFWNYITCFCWSQAYRWQIMGLSLHNCMNQFLISLFSFARLHSLSLPLSPRARVRACVRACVCVCVCVCVFCFSGEPWLIQWWITVNQVMSSLGWFYFFPKELWWLLWHTVKISSQL